MHGVAGGGAIPGGVHRLLLEQAPNLQTEPYKESYFTVQTVQNLKNTVKIEGWYSPVFIVQRTVFCTFTTLVVTSAYLHN